MSALSAPTAVKGLWHLLVPVSSTCRYDFQFVHKSSVEMFAVLKILQSERELCFGNRFFAVGLLLTAHAFLRCLKLGTRNNTFHCFFKIRKHITSHKSVFKMLGILFTHAQVSEELTCVPVTDHDCEKNYS